MKPLSLTKPHLIIMVGIPGSGKSFFAEHFAETFNAPYISIDKITNELMDGSADVDLSTVIRISGFLLTELLKSGQTIVYEGMTDSRAARQIVAKTARDNGYVPLLVWVQTESLAAKQRATKPRCDGSRMSDDEFSDALNRFTAPNPLEKPIVISGKHTFASQLRIVLKHVSVVRTDSLPAARPIIEGRHIAIR